MFLRFITQSKNKNRNLLIILVGLLVVVFLLNSLITPKPSQPPTAVTSQEEVKDKILTNSRIDIVLDPKFVSPTIPTSLPAYTYHRSELDLLSLGTQMAVYFHLEKSPKFSDGYWTLKKDESTHLVVNDVNHNIDYVVGYSASPQLYVGSSPANAEAAVSTTQKVLAQFPDIPPVKPIKSEFLLPDATIPQNQGPTKNSNLIETGFSPTVSDYFIFDPAYFLSPPVSSVVGQNNSLIGLRVAKTITTVDASQKNYPLFNQKQILENIRQGKISSLDDYPDVITDLTKISRLNIKLIEIIYYPDEKKSLLIPAFKITADVYSSGSVINESRILLPASEELLSN